MPLPEPRLLLLGEAAERVATACEVTLQVAKAALDRAFREGTLDVINTAHKTVEDWSTARISWTENSVTWRSPLGDGGHVDCSLAGASVDRVKLDEWIGEAIRRSKAQRRSAKEQRPYPMPDWAQWRARDLWRLDAAIALSCAINPHALEARNTVRIDRISVGLLPAEFHERLEIANSCVGMSLPSVMRSALGGGGGGSHVRPRVFARWALGKGWSAPPELRTLAAEGATGSGSSPTAGEAVTAEQARTDCPAPTTEAAGVPSSEPIKTGPPSTVLADAYLRDGLQQGEAGEATPARVPVATKRDAVASWIGEHFPEGIPAGMTAKEIALGLRNEKGIAVNVRTVRRALGRK